MLSGLSFDADIKVVLKVDARANCFSVEQRAEIDTVHCWQAALYGPESNQFPSAFLLGFKLYRSNIRDPLYSHHTNHRPRKVGLACMESRTRERCAVLLLLAS